MICDGLRYRRAGLLALLCLARQTRQAPVLLAEQEEIVIVKEGESLHPFQSVLSLWDLQFDETGRKPVC